MIDLNLETSGGNPKLKKGSIEQLQSIVDEYDLCDIWRIRNPDIKKFTWRGYAQGRVSSSNVMLHRRLDFFYISDGLQPMVQDTDIISVPSTDHSAITLSLKALPKSPYGPSFWKLNNSHLQDNNYVQMIRKLISDNKEKQKEENITNPQLCWELMKYEVRKASIYFAKEKAKRSRNSYLDIEVKLKEIERIKDWELDEMLFTEYQRLRLKLNQRSDHITEGIIIRSKTTWLEKGEKSNKYFLTLEKRRKTKTHVRKLLQDEKEIINPEEILKQLKSYYGNLYSSKNDLSEEQCLNFLQGLTTPSLSDQEINECEGLLTNKECYESLKEMKNNKTPGSDGISKEFYLAFWNELGQLMVDSFNYGFEMGTLSTTQSQAIITLLEKPNKDARLVENWRPISLMNVDSKVCSKALSNRMIDVLPKLIHPNQAAFVKGRNIDDPLRFLVDLFDYVENDENSPFILFAADFQKAFDSIEHNFIFAVLRHFGFGETFIHWIKTIFSNCKSCVINNGNATDFFDLKRGTKQGDPISPYLFVLTIEIMASMIRSNVEIQGVKVDKDMEETKLVLFADDATFCVKDVYSLEKILECLELFAHFSSLKLNLEKSEIGWIGDSKNEKVLETEIKKKLIFKVKELKFWESISLIIKNINEKIILNECLKNLRQPSPCGK